MDKETFGHLMNGGRVKWGMNQIVLSPNKSCIVEFYEDETDIILINKFTEFELDMLLNTNFSIIEGECPFTQEFIDACKR